ncbi:MAG: hypothetical protein PHN79_06145 [Methanoregula sp.]|nr:hypothetical protein [Methanoregula sp.]
MGWTKMGVFRYENKYAAPTKQQRERYMKGEYEEHLFGPDNQLMLILYSEAAYLKDDIDNIRILYTGFADKQKAADEVRRLLEYHAAKENAGSGFTTGNDARQ